MRLDNLRPPKVFWVDYLKHFPDDPYATRLIAQAALQQHGAPRAIDYLKPLVDKSPPDAATLTLLGNAYMADGKPEPALQQFEKAATLDPENATIKTQVAVAEMNSGQAGQGSQNSRRCSPAKPARPLPARPWYWLSCGAGHVDKAAEVAKSLIKRDPARTRSIKRFSARSAFAQRDYAGAETRFALRCRATRNSSAATRDLARLYATTGRTDDAKRIYSDLLAKNATDTMALLGLADIAICREEMVGSDRPAQQLPAPPPPTIRPPGSS